MYRLEFTDPASEQLSAIERNKSDRGLAKQVKKALGYLQTNPRHPSLNTHPYDSLVNPLDPREKVFGAYAQNNTPGAYRIFFIYGSAKKPPAKGRIITIIAIT
jgi:hypothetical protein